MRDMGGNLDGGRWGGAAHLGSTNCTSASNARRQRDAAAWCRPVGACVLTSLDDLSCHVDPRKFGHTLLSADRKRGRLKGSTSKNVQTSSRGAKNIFDTFRTGQKKSKIAKNVKNNFLHFQQFSCGANFPAPFRGLWFLLAWQRKLRCHRKTLGEECYLPLETK